MVHSSQALPLSDEHNSQTMNSWDPSHDNNLTTSASPNEHGALNQQAKRLQLRNAGFKGGVLPFRRISPLLGASGAGVEPFVRSGSQEYSPSSIEKRTSYGENIPESPVNIMQEIHKMSTRKKRTSPRPGFGAIFEDEARKEGTPGGSPTSWYKEGSVNCSPADLVVTPSRPRPLREISLNQKTPPSLGSPHVKHVKGRNSNKMKHRSASAEIAQYVEHLESELASAHAKLDSQPSPKTSKLRAAKLRALTTENRNLKQDNSEWEKGFDSRVQEERNKRLEADLELRTRMRMLEDELEMKDTRMREFEWEIESMRSRVRDLEDLEQINIGLEKRIEALTNLLVQSPTKLEVASASTSPVRRDPSKRTPRPQSMLPKVPASPGGLRLSLATVSESTAGRSKSFDWSANRTGSPEEVTAQKQGEEAARSPEHEGSMSPLCARQSGPFDRRSRPSISYRSAPSSASKRTSMRSSGCFGSVVWHLPEDDVKSITKQRKMRRFLSGSNSLKPLILPSASGVPSVPTTPPIFPSIETRSRQDISDSPLDPTSAFLSTLSDSSPTSASGRPGCQRSPTWEREQTLKALEGRSRKTDSYQENLIRHLRSQSRGQEEEQSIGFQNMPSDKPKGQSRPRSLQEELEDAVNIQDEVAHIQHEDVNGDPDFPVHPIIEDERSDPVSSRASLPPSRHRQQRLLRDSSNTPRPSSKQTLPNPASFPPVKAAPATALSPEQAHGLFFRLNKLVAETKQHPFILARRLLANAWSTGTNRILGGVGWWLLGLVYGTRWRKRKRADTDIVEEHEYPTASENGQHYPRYACQSCLVAQTLKRDLERGKRESWLSPPHVSHQGSTVRRSVPPFAPTNEQSRCYPCDKCVEPSSRRTLRLWLKFTLAVVLAVGLAVKDGPASLLYHPESIHQRCLEHEHGRQHDQQQELEKQPLLGQQRQKRRQESRGDDRDGISQQSRASQDTNGVDSGYGSILFAETLGPRDFEGR